MCIKIEEFHLPQINPFGTAYLDDYEQVSHFFHYSPYQQASFFTRMADVTQRDYDRHQLAQVLYAFHQKWGISAEVDQNITRLKQKESVVVIGGQQAGLLGGPLYTLHKVVTLLQMARQQEEKLGVPVIPLFWIAGEDHDYPEVNHTYIARKKERGLLKHQLPLADGHLKRSLSHRPLLKEETRRWVQTFFSQQPLTQYTADLMEMINQYIEQADTFVDFFAGVLHHLFSSYGLLMIDSADPAFRTLQSDTFVRIIQQYDQIDRRVRQQAQIMSAQQFQPQVELGDWPALLFIYEKGERLLLEKKGEHFESKDGLYHYTEEELLQIAREEPVRLSNNVITRPFMQESLFPTLAFVGGPGEIAYWALYRTFFEHFKMKLPIIVPRISMTIVDAHVAKTIKQEEIPLESIFTCFDEYRQNWLRQHDDLGLHPLFAQVKEKISQAYEPVKRSLPQVHKGLGDLAEKNLGKIMEQVDYLKKRSIADYSMRYQTILKRLDQVEQELYPQQMLQERVYNSFTFFNRHGMVLISLLMAQNIEINGKHKLIYMNEKAEPV